MAENMFGGPQVQARDRLENSPFPAADDPEIIEPILDALEADGGIRHLATEISARTESTMWIIGKRRSTVAATAVYVSGVVGTEAEPVFKQSEVAGAASISPASIANHREAVQTLYESLADRSRED